MESLAVDGFQDRNSVTISTKNRLPELTEDDGKGLTPAHQLVSSWLDGDPGAPYSEPLEVQDVPAPSKSGQTDVQMPQLTRTESCCA